MNFLSGWDCFKPDAGTVRSINCPTCGENMSVRRDCKGPRSWVESMAIKANVDPCVSHVIVKFDFFKCEHAKDPSHQKARDLKKLAQDTPSPTLEGIYLMDAEEILQTANFSYNGVETDAKASLSKADQWMKEEFGDRC